jgi:hypothetical protein
MKESPILFSPEMVQAIERKTMTRRIFKDAPRLASDLDKVDLKKWLKEFPDYILSFSPFGGVGDLLYVREKFRLNEAFEYEGGNYPAKYWYYASIPEKYRNIDSKLICRDDFKWKPSIHMPKEIARIWLQNTDISIERLQDISREDCRSEGIKQIGAAFRDYEFENRCTYNEKQSFKSLWNKINGAGSWDANPWVWAIRFKVLSVTGKPSSI